MIRRPRPHRSASRRPRRRNAAPSDRRRRPPAARAVARRGAGDPRRASRSSRSAWSPSSPAARCSCRAGRSAARRRSPRARRSDETELFQPFWDTYRAVTERYAGGDVDRKALVEGAIKGMIGALERPVLDVPDVRRVQAQPRGLSRRVRGHRGDDRDRRRGRRRPRRAPTLGPDCRMVIVAPIAGSPAEKAGLLAGDIVTAIDGEPRRRADARRGPRQGPRAEGHDGRADDRARRRRPARHRDRPRP